MLESEEAKAVRRVPRGASRRADAWAAGGKVAGSLASRKEDSAACSTWNVLQEAHLHGGGRRSRGSICLFHVEPWNRGSRRGSGRESLPGVPHLELPAPPPLPPGLRTRRRPYRHPVPRGTSPPPRRGGGGAGWVPSAPSRVPRGTSLDQGRPLLPARNHAGAPCLAPHSLFHVERLRLERPPRIASIWGRGSGRGVFRYRFVPRGTRLLPPPYASRSADDPKPHGEPVFLAAPVPRGTPSPISGSQLGRIGFRGLRIRSDVPLRRFHVERRPPSSGSRPARIVLPPVPRGTPRSESRRRPSPREAPSLGRNAPPCSRVLHPVAAPPPGRLPRARSTWNVSELRSRAPRVPASPPRPWPRACQAGRLDV